jgi:hypothetical protein
LCIGERGEGEGVGGRFDDVLDETVVVVLTQLIIA